MGNIKKPTAHTKDPVTCISQSLLMFSAALCPSVKGELTYIRAPHRVPTSFLEDSYNPHGCGSLFWNPLDLKSGWSIRISSRHKATQTTRHAHATDAHGDSHEGVGGE